MSQGKMNGPGWGPGGRGAWGAGTLVSRNHIYRVMGE